MQKRQRELEEKVSTCGRRAGRSGVLTFFLASKYEAMWDKGKGSHHPDFDPEAKGKATSHKQPRVEQRSFGGLTKRRARARANRRGRREGQPGAPSRPPAAPDISTQPPDHRRRRRRRSCSWR